MGDTQVAELRDRFERDGYVEIGFSAWKVGTTVGFVLLLAVTAGVITPGAGWFMRIVLILFVLLAVVGSTFTAKRAIAGGTALRIDGDGIRVATSSRPVALAWSDIVAVTEVRSSKLSGPMTGIVLSPTAWEEYVERSWFRHSGLRWLTTPSRSAIWLPKTLKVPAKTLISWLDQDAIGQLTQATPTPHLILAPAEDGHGPLFFRNGHGTSLDTLPLGDATRRSLQDWAVRANTALDAWEATVALGGRAETPEARRILDVLADDSRALAAHVAHELGASVTIWLDSPDVT